MQLSRRYEKTRTQTAIAVNTECLVAFTAIGVAASTGITMLAIQVWLDGPALANAHICHALTYGDDLNTQFMSGNSRIAEVRHFAQKTAEIRSADTNTMHAHQGLTGSGRGRLWNFDYAEVVWLFQLNGSHGVLRFNYFPADPRDGQDF